MQFSSAALLAVSLTACAERAADTAADAARLMETSRSWSRAAASGDVDAILEHWDEDALIMMADTPTVRGRDAIRSYVEASMKVPGFKISWEPVEAKISASGDMGYLIERTEVSTNGADGGVVTQHFRGVTIWKKQPGGAWKNVVDISNSEPSAQP